MIIQLVLLIFVFGYFISKIFHINNNNVLSCGLFGYSGNRYPDYNVLKLLALDAVNRGKDSTGVYGRGLWKTTDDAFKAVYQPEFKEALMANLVIGHTRASTMGAKSVDNAHPYEFPYDVNGVKGTLIGSHNGWLIEPEWQALKNDMEMPDVDSMLIFQKLIKDKLSLDSLKSLHGAMALAFTMDGKRLYLYKRNSKPLFLAQTGYGIYYSSRLSGLHLAGLKNTIIVPNHEIIGFEDGELVDHRYYGRPDIDMPVDTSPSKWREFDYEGKLPKWGQIYDEVRELKRKKAGTFKYEGATTKEEDKKKHKKQYSIPGLYDRNNNLFDRTRANRGNIGDIRDFINKFEQSVNMEDIVINSGDVTSVMKADSERSTVIAVLKEAGSNENLKEWYTFLEIDPEETIGRSTQNGVATMSINTLNPIKTRIIVVPPFSDDAFYSKQITINPSSVLEVSLSLKPFPQRPTDIKKKEEKTDVYNNSRGSEDTWPISTRNSKDKKASDKVIPWSELGTLQQREFTIESIMNVMIPEIPTDSEEMRSDKVVYTDFEDFPCPPVAYSVYREIFKDETKSPKDNYDAFCVVMNDLNDGNDFLGQTEDEISDKLRREIYKNLSIIMDAITVVYGYSIVLKKLTGYISGMTWWDAYREIRTTIELILQSDQNLVDDMTFHLAVEEYYMSDECKEIRDSLVNVPKTILDDYKKDLKNKSTDPEITLSDKRKVTVIDKQLAGFVQQYDKIINNDFTDFWSVGSFIGRRGFDLKSGLKELIDVGQGILKSLMAYKIKISQLYIDNYHQMDIANEAVEEIVKKIERPLDDLKILYGLPSIDLNEETAETGEELKDCIEDVITDSYDDLLMLTREVVEQSADRQPNTILPF